MIVRCPDKYKYTNLEIICKKNLFIMAQSNANFNLPQLKKKIINKKMIYFLIELLFSAYIFYIYKKSLLYFVEIREKEILKLEEEEEEDRVVSNNEDSSNIKDRI